MYVVMLQISDVVLLLKIPVVMLQVPVLSSQRRSRLFYVILHVPVVTLPIPVVTLQNSNAVTCCDVVGTCYDVADTFS